MKGKADLHTHTVHSDGVLTPRELIRKAYSRGLSAVGITDHDTVAGIDDAMDAAREFGIEAVPGIEISCYEKQLDFHVLGYFIDPTNANLLRYVAYSLRERRKRAERIIAKLNRIHIPLSLDDVRKISGDGLIGRLHIARALIAGGHATTIKEIFDRYLGPGCPAYEAKWRFSIANAIELIHQAGGLAVLAHPGRHTSERHIREMVISGLDGIEVIHPCHNSTLQKYYRSVVHEFGLLETGGSDYHGNRDIDENNLGKLTIPYAGVEAMRYCVENA